MGRRIIRCRVCGEQWHPKDGKVYEFLDKHAELHNLQKPNPEDFDSLEEYLAAVREFKEKYFEEKFSEEK